MFTFPERTRLTKPTRMDKKGLLRNLDLNPQEKRDLTNQVQRIQITHQIDQSTTNILGGKTVQQIMVMNIQLKSTEINRDLLAAIDEQISMYLIFIIETGDDKCHLLINYKEPLATIKNKKRFSIKRSFESTDSQMIDFKGSSLDEVYENLVFKAAGKKLVALSASDIGKSIEKAKELEKLLKQAEQLKKKMFSEKSMRKQMEAKNERNKVLGKIESIKKSSE